MGDLDFVASRKSWGAQHDDGDLTLSGPAREVFVHHTVTAQLSPSASVDDEREQMRKIEAVGESRFKTGISYNVVIFPSGRAYQGASWNRRGTHTGGRNSTSRSICYAGNYETNHPTEAALATGARIFQEGKGELWYSSAPLRGHRDVSQTACPGKHLYSKISRIRSGSTSGGGGGSSTPAPAKPGKLVVDGRWGRATTTALQRKLGTPVDGVVSSQERAYERSNPGLRAGWEWTDRPRGSKLIMELQERVGVPAGERDGILGPDTIKRLQKHLGTPVDGVLSDRSQAIMALQGRINSNRKV